MNGSRSKMTRFLALTVIIAASVGVLALMRMGDQEREAQMAAREPSSTVREVQERQDVTRESQDQTDEPAVSEGTTESGRVAFRQPEERRDVPGYEVAPSGRGGRGGTDVDDAATPVDSAEVVKIREQFEPRLQELEASCTRRAQELLMSTESRLEETDHDAKSLRQLQQELMKNVHSEEVACDEEFRVILTEAEAALTEQDVDGSRLLMEWTYHYQHSKVDVMIESMLKLYAKMEKELHMRAFEEAITSES